MHKNVGEAIEACRRLEELAAHSLAEVVVCAPPFTSLSALNALGLTKIKLGAQNMHFADQGGIYRGNIRADADRCGLPICNYRTFGKAGAFGEDDGMINKKSSMHLN